MWILTVASFIAVMMMMMMMMMEVLCWPSMSNIAALYTEDDMFLNFEVFNRTEVPPLLIIVFKNYHYVKYVNVTLRNTMSEF